MGIHIPLYPFKSTAEGLTNEQGQWRILMHPGKHRKCESECIRSKKHCKITFINNLLAKTNMLKSMQHKCFKNELDIIKQSKDMAICTDYIHTSYGHMNIIYYVDFSGRHGHLYVKTGKKPRKGLHSIIFLLKRIILTIKYTVKRSIEYATSEMPLGVIVNEYMAAMKETGKILKLQDGKDGECRCANVTVGGQTYVPDNAQTPDLNTPINNKSNRIPRKIPPLHPPPPYFLISSFKIAVWYDCFVYKESRFTDHEYHIGLISEIHTHLNSKTEKWSIIKLPHTKLVMSVFSTVMSVFSRNDDGKLATLAWLITPNTVYSIAAWSCAINNSPEVPQDLFYQTPWTTRNSAEVAGIAYTSNMRKSGTPALNVSLVNDDGIKYLACVFERTACGDFEPDLNRYYKGGIHNYGHVYMSEIGCPSDPINRVGGVVGHPVTAVRDPLFFRWHKFVDGVFQSQKKELPSYNLSQLVMEGVTVMSVGVFSIGKEGELYTFKDINKLTLPGIESTSTCTNYPKLNHHPFKYNIIIDNSVKRRTRGRSQCAYLFGTYLFVI
ncbi:unnamed protein product [Meganyctiphanes norvegica]|uniref:Tyrosinase copper-binding domain-containing protein n=1 Tax=Meganyctiphanes norvegica TaxID=48144 RepID=A0AAV2S207_MEGNR